MKTFFLTFTLAFTFMTIQAQQVFTAEQNNDPKAGEKVVSVYQQLAEHTQQLEAAKEIYTQQLAEATTVEEQTEIQAVITNIEEMIELNIRLQAGKAMIHSVDSLKSE